MSVSPEEINDKSFDTRWRGYDIDEVNDFLNKIQKDLSSLLKRYEHAAEYASDSKSKLTYYQKRSHVVGQSIIVARSEANQIIKNAKQEANIIKRNANQRVAQEQQNFDKQTKAHYKHVNRIIKSANNLCSNTQSFRHQICVLLQSQINFTKDHHWNDAFKAEHKVTSYSIPQIATSRSNNVTKVNTDQHLPSRMSHKTVIFYPNGDMKEA